MWRSPLTRRCASSAAGRHGLLTTAHALKLGEVISKLFEPTGDPQRFVTHWGLDPIWGSAPGAGPYIHQFPLRTAVGHTVSLLEAPGYDVTVVGHQPQFDEGRRLGTATSSSTRALRTTPSSGSHSPATSRTRSRASICPPSSSRSSHSSPRSGRRRGPSSDGARCGLAQRAGWVHACRGDPGSSRRPAPAARPLTVRRRPGRAPPEERGHRPRLDACRRRGAPLALGHARPRRHPLRRRSTAAFTR